MKRKRRNIPILLALGTIGVLVFSASMASAKHGTDDPAGHIRHGGASADSPPRSGGNDGVRRSGACSASSSWKLNAKPRDGRLETEFEVDQNRSGVRWHFKLSLNGTKVAEGNRVTKPPSGSFTVERRLANSAGPDKISAVATRNGERCRGSLTI